MMFHKSRPPLAKSLLAVTNVPNVTHIIIHLYSKLCFLQNAIIFIIYAVAIPHTTHTADRIYIEILLRIQRKLSKVFYVATTYPLPMRYQYNGLNI